MEPEFIDEERVPLIDRYEDNDDSVYEDLQAETSFTQEDEQQQQDLDVEINSLERGFNVKISPEERSRFRLSSGYLQVEKSPGEYVSVTRSNGELLAASTLRNRLGAALARSLLGVETPERTGSRSRSRVLLQDIPSEIEMDELTPLRLEEVISEVTRSIGINTDLDMREFLGIDKALTRIKGELENNAGKLTEIDEHLKREERKLAEIETSPDLREHEQRVKAKIADLNEERSARLEIISQNRKELSSQFSRIRQTVEKILDEDLSLREKLKLVFREHGLTITAVLTSLGLIISTLVTSLTGGSAGSSPTPPKHPNKLKDWIEKKLKALARLFGRLAGKAAAALPGILGSVVAGVLNFLTKVVTAAAGHVWLFLLSIATLIGYKLIDSFQKQNAKNR